MIPSVWGSFRKTSRQSIKLVPLKGSPPIPEKKIKPHKKRLTQGNDTAFTTNVSKSISAWRVFPKAHMRGSFEGSSQVNVPNFCSKYSPPKIYRKFWYLNNHLANHGQNIVHYRKALYNFALRKLSLLSIPNYMPCPFIILILLGKRVSRLTYLLAVLHSKLFFRILLIWYENDNREGLHSSQHTGISFFNTTAIHQFLVKRDYFIFLLVKKKQIRQGARGGSWGNLPIQRDWPSPTCDVWWTASYVRVPDLDTIPLGKKRR